MYNISKFLWREYSNPRCFIDTTNFRVLKQEGLRVYVIDGFAVPICKISPCPRWIDLSTALASYYFTTNGRGNEWTVCGGDTLIFEDDSRDTLLIGECLMWQVTRPMLSILPCLMYIRKSMPLGVDQHHNLIQEQIEKRP